MLAPCSEVKFGWWRYQNGNTLTNFWVFLWCHQCQISGLLWSCTRADTQCFRELFNSHPVSVRIWILSLEFIACCQKSHSQGFCLPKVIFMSSARLWELWVLCSCAIQNSGLACRAFTQQHLNMCRNANSPPLLSLSLSCHDLKTCFTLSIVKFYRVCLNHPKQHVPKLEIIR